MITKGILRLPVTAAGGTYSLPVTYNVSNIEMYTGGAVTLLAHSTLNVTGTPVDGQQITISCNLKNLDLDVYNLTILGETINQDIVTNCEFLVIGIYSSVAGKFITHVLPNFSSSTFVNSANLAANAVATAKIADNAVTYAKLQDLTGRGYLIRGGVSGAPEDFNAKTSGQLVMGNGTDVASVAMSGDVTINGSGVTTIGAGKVTQAMLAFTLASYLEVTRTLTSAEILALRTTAIDIISAPGSGKYLEIVSATGYNNYNSTTYNAGTDLLNLEINGVAVWTFPNSFVEATSDTANQGTRVADAAIATNSGLKARMSSADPTTGNGTITIKAIYRICDAV